MSNKVKTFTEEQAELFELGESGQLKLPRVAVSADAGAGKTSVLVERVQRLPRDKRILCVSFTEKSKADLEQRLAEWIHAEVYTIHGFCGRIVSEFGSHLGLPPIFRILDQDEANELFYECFEKVYRREPVDNAFHGVETFFRLCLKSYEVGEDVHIFDCADGNPQLEEFVRKVLTEFENAKNSRRVLDYSDLEKFAVKLLNRKEVVAQYQERYGHFFVDEFQDTSHLQGALVEMLAARNTPLFVVGDEKQSIYRFRGADVRVFRDFVSKLPARRRLSSNFRSHSEIIEAVNRVCSMAISEYSPMVAGRGVSRKYPDWDLPRVCRIQSDSDADGIEAILRKLKSKNIDWSDVVILTRRMRGNEKLFAELGRRGISIVSGVTSVRGSESIQDTENNIAIRKMLNLWIWACEPWQKLRAAQVIVDFKIGSVFELDQKLEQLVGPLQFSGQMSCEQLLSQLDKSFSLGTIFGAAYEQFKLFLMRNQSSSLLPGALARKLQRLLKHDKEISGFSLVPPPANLTGAVRAMTVHSSKGLEFPVVILADIKPRRVRGDASFRYRENIWLYGRDEEGALDKSGGPYKDELAAALKQEMSEDLQESARLLYVAMTRAEEALYVVDSNPEKKKASVPSWESWLHEGLESYPVFSAQSWLSEFEGALDGAFDSAASKLGALTLGRSSPTANSVVPVVYDRARVGVTEFVKRMTQGVPVPSVESKESLSDRKGLDPRRFGTEMHRYLECSDWDGLAEAAKKYRVDLKLFWDWLKTPEGKLCFDPEFKHRVYNEFAFEWNRGESEKNTILTGRVDRLVVTHDVAYVFDYKFFHGKRALVDLEVYSGQMKIYAQAIHHWCKLPVRAVLLDVLASTGTIWHDFGLYT